MRAFLVLTFILGGCGGDRAVVGGNGGTGGTGGAVGSDGGGSDGGTSSVTPGRILVGPVFAGTFTSPALAVNGKRASLAWHEVETTPFTTVHVWQRRTFDIDTLSASGPIELYRDEHVTGTPISAAAFADGFAYAFGLASVSTSGALPVGCIVLAEDGSGTITKLDESGADCTAATSAAGSTLGVGAIDDPLDGTTTVDLLTFAGGVARTTPIANAGAMANRAAALVADGDRAFLMGFEVPGAIGVAREPLDGSKGIVNLLAANVASDPIALTLVKTATGFAAEWDEDPPQLALLDGTGATIASPRPLAGLGTGAVVTWSGSAFVAAEADLRGLVIASYDAQGALIGTLVSPRPVGGFVAIAPLDDGSVLVAWSEAGDGGEQIALARVAPPTRG